MVGPFQEAALIAPPNSTAGKPNYTNPFFKTKFGDNIIMVEGKK